MIVDEDLNNVFERVTARMQPETEIAMEALRAQGRTPHLAGAGPSFFLLLPDGAEGAHDAEPPHRRPGFRAARRARRCRAKRRCASRSCRWREVFAGFVVGYALALLVAPLAALALVRSNDRTGLAQRVAPPGTSIIALSVVLHFAALLVLTALGLVLGMALARHRRRGVRRAGSAARTWSTRCSSWR